MEYQRTNFLTLLFIVIILVLVTIFIWDQNKNTVHSILSNNLAVESLENCEINTKQKRCTHYQAQDVTKYVYILPDHPLKFDGEVMIYLSKQMVDKKIKLNKKIPLGFTFIGQFLAHDITFNRTENFRDKLINTNKRTPYMDLDSVYDLGPDKRPDMYDGDLLRWNLDQNDLIRDDHGVAIIGDERNDENALISQTHLIFIRYHNKLCRKGLDYHAARQEVVWTYQYLILYDFLVKFCTAKIIRKMISQKPFLESAAIPHEFSVAALRFGHSTLVDDIIINDKLKLKLDDMFEYSDKMEINWAKFFGSEAQHTRTIGPHITPLLSNLPDSIGKLDNIDQNSLALRNLNRGMQFGLCSGQELSKYLKGRPLTQKQLEDNFPATKKYGLSTKTPLWYYCLAEAAIRGKGEHLGTLGATLVAGVIVNILKYDSHSFLNNPEWKPKVETFDQLCRYVFAKD